MSNGRLACLEMLPVLDFQTFLQNPHSESGVAFAQDLVNISHNVGFFYLIGHGIEQRHNDRLMALAKRFFALPESARHAIEIKHSPHFRGYTILGDERTQGKSDWRDQIDIGVEEEAVQLKHDDPPWMRLRGPNQWPTELPELREAVNGWAEQMNTMALELFRALAIGLSQDYHYFDDTMTPDPYMRIKISRYPGQADSPSRRQGLGLHHDSGLFTFIFQNDVVGLQVERDGQLVDVEPLPGAFIVNLGEMFQIATDGYLKATKHQVVSPAAGVERISVAYFMNPRLSAVFDSVPLPPHLAALAPGGQNDDRADPVHATFGENTLKIRMRAHPDVVAAHYSDVAPDG
ncbi:MAG: 2-oxoglutarate and iron-dependent oxygenase domain-containing protein [Pseudomonadota bacterium]